jgi:hypothetical protein
MPSAALPSPLVVFKPLDQVMPHLIAGRGFGRRFSAQASPHGRPRALYFALTALLCQDAENFCPTKKFGRIV